MINLVFYTNCQYRVLDYFIKNHINKIETKHIENYSLIKNKNQIPFDILKQADIFIYQPIDKKHGIYSTDISVENNIMSYLSPNCKIISFPYIYNSSLWILIPPANADGYIGNYVDMDKYINREPIEKLKVKGYSLDEVLQMYSKGEIDFDYKNRFNKSIEILKKKEEICDVKVAAFIEKNIRKHKLFFTQNHPTTCVFIHCVNQILSILGHNHKFDEFSYPENICNLPGRWPHTSYDIKYWNFEYKNNNINNSWYIHHIKNIYNNYIVKVTTYSTAVNRGLVYFIKDFFTRKNIDLHFNHIQNYYIILHNKSIPIDILKQSDIFIYQPIEKKYGIYSTDTSVENNIMSYLSTNCKSISFPYIYNSALWILIPPAKCDYIGGFGEYDKYINREPIEKLKAKGYSLDEVLQMYSKGLIDFDYENRFTKSIETLKKKEELCDVKVAAFIEKNIRKHKLFFTQNHPTTCVFIHCVNQILSILGHNHKFDEFSYPENICNLPGRWPHTSYDIKYWNFEYKNNNINNSWYINHIKNIYNNYCC